MSALLNRMAGRILLERQARARAEAAAYAPAVVPVHPSGPLTLWCGQCGRQVHQAHGPVYAHPDDEPFTYRCPPCAGMAPPAEDEEAFARRVTEALGRLTSAEIRAHAERRLDRAAEAAERRERR